MRGSSAERRPGEERLRVDDQPFYRVDFVRREADDESGDDVIGETDDNSLLLTKSAYSGHCMTGCTLCSSVRDQCV